MNKFVSGLVGIDEIAEQSADENSENDSYSSDEAIPVVRSEATSVVDE